VAAVVATAALALTMGALTGSPVNANPPDRPYPGGQDVDPPDYPLIGGYFSNPSNLTGTSYDMANVNIAWWSFSTIGMPGAANDGQCTPATAAQLSAAKAFRAANPQTKIIRSIGGWGGRGFSNAVRTQAGREKLAKSCVERFMDEDAVDGFDFDWEFPVTGGPLNIGYHPDDRENHNLMVIEFRNQMNAWAIAHDKDPKEYWLTAATPAGRWQTSDFSDDVFAPYDPTRSFDFEFLGRTLEAISIMAYEMGCDLNGDFSMPNQPLYYDPRDTSGDEYNSGVDSVRLYLEQGVDPKKIVYGVMWTGARGFTLTQHWPDDGMYKPAILPTGAGSATWANAQSASRVTLMYWNDLTKNETYYDMSTLRVGSVENAQTIYDRAKWAADNGLNGMMSWTLSNSNSTQYPEIRAAVRAFYPEKSTEPPAPTVKGALMHPITGVEFDGEVAHVTGSAATTLTAIINWGDKTRSIAADVQVVPLGGGEFSVRAKHTYAAAGKYELSVKVIDPLIINTRATNAWAMVGAQVGIDSELDVTLTGTSLSLEVPVNPTVSFGAFTLNGSDQITRGHAMNPAFVTDARGTGEGWTLVGVASDFVGDNTGRRILSANLGWFPKVTFAPVVDEGLAHDPVNVPMKLPGAPIWPGEYQGLSTPKTACYTGGGVSTGRFKCDAELVLGIPWSTPADHYTSVLTLTLI